MTQTTPAAAVPTTETATCRLCGSQKFVKIATAPDWLMPEQGLFSVYRCTNCELGETRPKLSPAELAVHYPRQDYSAYHMLPNPSRVKTGVLGKLQRLYAQLFYQAIQSPSFFNRIGSGLLRMWPLSKWISVKLPYNKKPGKLLDIGCAQGHFLRSTHAEGWTGFGIEMTEGLADSLISEGIADIRYSRFEEIKFEPDTQFDAITMWHVLEHFENPVPVLNRCYELLADDGFIAIGIPILSPLEIAIFGKHWHAWELPRHQSHFTPAAIRNLFQKTGFEITSFNYEANINNWIHSLNNRTREKGFEPKFSVHNPILQRALKPLSLLLKLTRLSGRVIIYGRKKRAI